MGAAREWMQQVTIRCFVSSTWFDLEPERDAVESLLQRFRETKFIGMEYFGSRDETTRQVSLNEVDRSDLYVGVIGGRYGSGITEAEYDRAIERKLPCLIYFKHEAAIEPEGRDQKPAEIENLRKFKDKIRDHVTGHTVAEFSGSNDLASRLASDLHNWLFDRYLAPVLSADGVGANSEQAEAIGGDLKHVASLYRELSAKVAEEKRIAREAYYYLTYNVPPLLANHAVPAQEREAVVRYTVGQLDQLVELNPSEPYVLRELATNYRVLAAILEDQNRIHEAYAAFRKSAGYCAKLVTLRPGEALYHRDLAVSHYNAGRLTELEGDKSRALDEYRISLDSARRAAGMDGQWADIAKLAGERVTALNR
jgi:hypothetical protein